MNAATSFSERLEELHGDVEGFLAIVYFDDTQALHRGNEELYFALMNVFSIISAKPIFFVFSSTNPILNQFSQGDSHTPSSTRVRKGQKLIPPIF